MPAIRYRFALLPALALVAVVGLVAACDDDDDDGGDAVTLHLGTVLPETGGLSNLGRPMIAAVRLAEADIKAAGGDIQVTYADSATSPETAPEAVNRLLSEGVHAIVGAGASGVSQSFIQILFDEKIPQCSPSNTSPSFSTQENAAYYFRTVPPDIAIAPILADLVTGDGHTRISLIARADDWGQSLLHELEKELSAVGAEYDSVLYDPAAISFDAEVSRRRELRSRRGHQHHLQRGSRPHPPPARSWLRPRAPIPHQRLHRPRPRQRDRPQQPHRH